MNTLCFMTGMTSAEWAAWVQAVGSVIAILVAVAVPAWQKRSADRAETARRTLLASDLALALFHELANRAARCCQDFESPWMAYWQVPIPRVDRFGAGKFMPEAPATFNANTDKLALLGSPALSAVIAFYYRLGALGRDIENLRVDARDHSDIGVPAVKIIASRFAGALAPALDALTALGALVPNAEAIEADAVSTVSVPRSELPGGTLRERLRNAIEKADEIRRKVER